MLFGKKKLKRYVFIDDVIYYVDDEVADHIDKLNEELQNTLDKLFAEKSKLMRTENELKAIKQLVESKEYKPAMSKDCQDCKYALKSKFNGELIGCRKDNLCNDFEPV